MITKDNGELGVSLELTANFIADVTLIYTKADKSNSCLKAEVDNKLTVVDDLIRNNYYYKGKINNSFALSADLSSQANLTRNHTNAITTINTTLNNKSDKSDSYTRAEIIGFIDSYHTFNGSFLKITDPSSNKFRISVNPATINIFDLLKTNEIKV